MSEAAKKQPQDDDGKSLGEKPLGPDDVRGVVAAVKARAEKKGAQRSKARELEGTLVEDAKAGDAAAFRKLVEMNQGRLYAVAFGMLRDRDEAMDVVQDAFIKAHRKLADFEGNSAFSTWLYRICVNRSIDKKRAKARRRQVDLDAVKGLSLSDDSVISHDIVPRLGGANPLRNVANQELAAKLNAAMEELSDDHRAVVLLREVEGMSYEEISQVLDIPKGTVMSRLFHARKNMQKLLRPYLGLREGEPLSAGRSGPLQGEETDEE